MAHTDLSSNIGIRAMEAEDRGNTEERIALEGLPFLYQIISFISPNQSRLEKLLRWELGHNIAFIAVCRFMYL